MKQVKVNGLIVYTGPDTDARRQAADLVRQLVLKQDSIVRRDRMEAQAARIQSGELKRLKLSAYDISVVNADITYHVPECGHELYAANACRTDWCWHYYKPWKVADAA